MGTGRAPPLRPHTITIPTTNPTGKNASVNCVPTPNTTPAATASHGRRSAHAAIASAPEVDSSGNAASAVGWNMSAAGTSGQIVADAHASDGDSVRRRAQGVDRDAGHRAGHQEDEPGRGQGRTIGRRQGRPGAVEGDVERPRQHPTDPPGHAGMILHEPEHPPARDEQARRVRADVERVLALDPFGVRGEERGQVGDLPLRDRVIAARTRLDERERPLVEPEADRRPLAARPPGRRSPSARGRRATARPSTPARYSSPRASRKRCRSRRSSRRSPPARARPSR